MGAPDFRRLNVADTSPPLCASTRILSVVSCSMPVHPDIPTLPIVDVIVGA